MADTQTATQDQNTTSPLPSLTPESPYKPLELPQVAAPRILSEGLPKQEPIQNLGATSKAGGVAYLVNQVLHGAVQGYDAARIQHAQQFNNKLGALQTLDQQLGQQYQDAYNQAGSTPKKDGSLPTPQEILANPQVQQLHNQLMAVHQASLQAIQGYLPQLKPDKKSTKKTGKDGQQPNILETISNAKNDPNAALRAYAEASAKLGPSAFYQVATPQQLKAMYDQRQTAGISGGTAVTTATTGQTTAATTATRADIEKKYTDAVASGDQATASKYREQLEQLEAKTLPVELKEYKLPDNSYQWYDANRPDTIPKDASAVPVGAGANRAPKVGWTKQDGRWGQIFLDPNTDQMVPGSFNPDVAPPAYVLSEYPTTRSTEGKYVDSNGVLQEFGTTSSSSRALPSDIGEGTPTAPTHSQFMAALSPKGLISAGNIPIWSRPTVHNADGSHSTEFSVSVGNDQGQEVLLPTVVNGKFLTPDGKIPPNYKDKDFLQSAAGKALTEAAWKHYEQTGENLGVFDNAKDADAYANVLHNRGEQRPSATTPTQRSTVAHTASPSSHPVGYVGSATYKGLVKQATDAQRDFDDVGVNLKTMLSTAPAAKQGNGPAMMGITSAFLKSTIGGKGSGVRINRPEWDAARKTRPWLEGAKATFSPAGIMTGNTISPLQVDQMIGEVNARAHAQYDNVQQAKQRVTDQRTADMQAGGLTPPAQNAPQQPTHGVSLKQAMSLPQYKGKTAEEVTAAIKARGYEVLP